VSRWLQTKPPVRNNQLYKIREGEYATWEINREERSVGLVVKVNSR
jgi:hypothetical protein